MFYDFFDDFFWKFDDLFKDCNSCNKEEEKEDAPFSYYHYVEKKYENGKEVSKREKEIKNGKIVKDINEKKCLDIKKETKALEDNKPKDVQGSDKCKCGQDSDEKIEKLINDVNQLEESLRKSEAENRELRKKLENIKSLF